MIESYAGKRTGVEYLEDATLHNTKTLVKYARTHTLCGALNPPLNLTNQNLFSTFRCIFALHLNDRNYGNSAACFMSVGKEWKLKAFPPPPPSHKSKGIIRQRMTSQSKQMVLVMLPEQRERNQGDN